MTTKTHPPQQPRKKGRPVKRFIQLFNACTQNEISNRIITLKYSLTSSTLPPDQTPTRLLEVISSRITLNNGPEIHIQDPRVSIGTGAFRPFEVVRARSDSHVVFDFRAGAVEGRFEDALHYHRYQHTDSFR